jgi:hypothetical protein
MKTLLQILIVILCAWGIIHLDVMLYDFLASLIPNGDWKPLLKVAIVVVMVIYTTGLTIVLITIASAISLFILDLFLPQRSGFMKTGPLRKSKFQEKMEEMQKKRKGL